MPKLRHEALSGRHEAAREDKNLWWQDLRLVLCCVVLCCVVLCCVCVVCWGKEGMHYSCWLEFGMLSGVGELCFLTLHTKLHYLASLTTQTFLAVGPSTQTEKNI